MNTKHHFSLLFSVIFCTAIFSQGTWVQKTNSGGGLRRGAVGFSIGNKGYIGTGDNGSGISKQDFWEWEQAGNTWTQKANFGGTARSFAVGFSIGTKGYIGTGNDGAYKKDFWEWDGDTASAGYNTWTKKADFGGTARYLAVGFSIGGKGYIGTGDGGGSIYKQDFWEWDQAADTWMQKANVGGTVRWSAVGFSIGTKGYIGTGADNNVRKDFWEWDGDTASASYNTWIKKADVGGTVRQYAIGFSIGTKGYIGTGWGGTLKQDFWEWNQASNTWTQKANVGGTARDHAVGFSIGTKGYVGTGAYGASKQDFWEYADSAAAVVNELINASSVSVFPNPTTGEFVVQIQDAINVAANMGVEMEIYNLQGEKKYQSVIRNSEFKVNISDLSRGVYILQIKTDKEKRTQKLIIN